MAKGDLAKKSIVDKLKSCFGEDWIGEYSKKYYVYAKENGEKILYTSDSNDIEFLKKVIKDKTFTKIYTEVGDTPSVHTDYKELKKLDKNKLILMHIENMDLYERIIKEGYKVPKRLK